MASNTLREVFSGCGFTSLDLSNWDVSGIANMQNAFGGSDLITLNVSNWDVSNVTNMQGMFKLCTDLTSLDLSNWDVSSVNTMREMFYRNYDLTSIGDVSSWDVGLVTDMFSLFDGDNDLVGLDLSNWDTSSVLNMQRMLKDVDNFDNSLANWDINQVTNFTDFMNSATGLSTANYDATLISWSGQTPNTGESINFGGSQYTLGGTAETARNTLINTYSWTITDGGGI
jgi:surface protein